MREAYRGLSGGPSFRFTDGSVRVTLPVAGPAGSGSIVDLFVPGVAMTRAQVQEAVGLGQAATAQRLKALVDAGELVRVGAGPATAYRLP